MSKDEIEEVASPDVILRFEGRRCVHARNCVLARPDVFVPNAQGEWLHPEHATADEIAALAHACPSGAITYLRRDGKPDERPPLVNTVRVRENGPLVFHGDLRVAGEPPRTRATLCRCGASQQKPFCDGSHTAAGFAATGEPAAQASEPLTARDGELELHPQKNGPLQVTGNLEVVSGTGRTVNRVGETWLCRCGHSRDKPYCDGSHSREGFEAPGEG
ncbi:MAG TPA: CDGSH iron-sulfur domain-containing protein [Kofleriaceae bacterium]|nr:CDGSH iron-sulfur domain-containing protein [Kofleriaceae bacterium]